MVVPLDRCFLTDIVSKYEGRVKQNLLGQFIRKTAMTPDDKLAVIKELVLPQRDSVSSIVEISSKRRRALRTKV